MKSWRRLESCVEDARAAVHEVGAPRVAPPRLLDGRRGLDRGRGRADGRGGRRPRAVDPGPARRVDATRQAAHRDARLARPLAPPGIPGVSPAHSRKGFDRARERGADGSYVVIRGAVHGIALRSPWGELVPLPKPDRLGGARRGGAPPLRRRRRRSAAAPRDGVVRPPAPSALLSWLSRPCGAPHLLERARAVAHPDSTQSRVTGFGHNRTICRNRAESTASCSASSSTSRAASRIEPANGRQLDAAVRRTATCPRPRRPRGTCRPTAASSSGRRRPVPLRGGRRSAERGRGARRPRWAGSAPAPASRDPAAARAAGRELVPALVAEPTQREPRERGARSPTSARPRGDVLRGAGPNAPR